MRLTAFAALCFLPSAFSADPETCSSEQCPGQASPKDTILLQAKVTAHGGNQASSSSVDGANKQQRAKKQRRVLAKLARRRATWARVKEIDEKPFAHRSLARVGSRVLVPPQRVRYGKNSFFKRTSIWKRSTASKELTKERMRALEWQAHVEVPERLRSLKADVGKLPLVQQSKVNHKFAEAGHSLAGVVQHLAQHPDMQDPQMQWIHNQLEELWWVVGELEHMVHHRGHYEDGHHYDDGYDGDEHGVNGEVYCETGERLHNYDLCLDTSGDGGLGCCHWNEGPGRCWSDIGRSTCHSAHDYGYNDCDDHSYYYYHYYYHEEVFCEDLPIPPNPHANSCEEGLALGLCQEMPEEASHFCPLTCGYCAHPPDSPEWGCVDRPLPPNPYAENCETAHMMGLCNEFPMEAQMWCPVTCGPSLGICLDGAGDESHSGPTDALPCQSQMHGNSCNGAGDPETEYPMSGEEYCERDPRKHSFEMCMDSHCCHWNGGSCSSSVGNSVCEPLYASPAPAVAYDA